MGQTVPTRRRFVCTEPLEMRTLMSTVPNDPDYNIDQRFTNISAPLAWDITTGTRSVDAQGRYDLLARTPVIAVLDTGMDINHPDLIDNRYVSPFEIEGDGIDNDANGFIDDVYGWDFTENDNDVDDVDTHGTHVAGIIGAKGNNGVGITGVAWNTTLLPIKALGDSGSGTFGGINEGIRYATLLKRQGINIVAINASLGGTDPVYNFETATAIREAGEAGILFIAAAGNDTLDNNPSFNVPAKFALSQFNVIAVASTNAADEISDFSNFGQTSVQLAAPGSDIYSTQPGGGYQFLSGTSMAAPEVAGAIALMASANPRATAQQLKDTLLASVDVLESLDRPNDLPFLVSTSGRLNVYKAVQSILNSVVKVDAGTSGDWKGKYGSEAYDIPGDVRSSLLNDPLVTYTVTDETGNTAGIGTGNAGTKSNALESVTSTEKVGTFYEAQDLIDVRVGIPNLPHRISLYFTQFSGTKRTQMIEVFDPGTGALLAVTEVGDFAKGKYVTLDISGQVQIRVSKVKGASVVLNGLFVDPVPVGPSNFRADTTTGGDFRKEYDTDGAVIIGRTDFPTGVVGTITDATTRIVSNSTTRKGALLQEGESRKGSVGYSATETSAVIDLNFDDDTAPHQVSIYAIDFDKKKRAQRVELLNAAGNLLDQRELTNFTAGVYLTWDVVGDAKIRFTKLQGPDAVISAIFIDEVVGESGHFIGQNRTQGGFWRGVYGSDSAFIVGDRDDTFTPGQGFSLDQTGGMVRVVDSLTSTNKAAVLKYLSSTNRIAAQLETRDEMTITLELPEIGAPQRVSFYAADYEKKRRAQRIELFDDNGVLIGSTDMVAFNNGVYATFDLNGTVTAKFTNLEDNSNRAVLSAVYYD